MRNNYSSIYDDSLCTVSMAGDQLILHTDLFPPVRFYVNYYNINGTSSQYQVRLHNKKQLSISLSSSDEAGFACWNISDCNCEGGSIFHNRTSSDVNALMSCCREYTLTYDGNGGTGEMPSVSELSCKFVNENYAVTETYGSATLSDSRFEREKYRYTGWTINQAPMQPGDTVPLSADVTAYAAWEWFPECVLSLNVNNELYGSVSDNSGTYDFKTVVQISAQQNYGYDFNRWSDGSTDTDRTLTLTGDTLLTAYFGVHKYTVTFDANGGTCGESTRLVPYNTEIGELPVAAKEHYDTTGWYFEDEYSPVSSTTLISCDITCYAQYTGKMYTVTFDPCGGESRETSRQVAYNHIVGSLPLVVLSHYTFQGWYDAGGTKFENDTLITGDITLYAKLTANFRKIIYVKNFWTVTFDPRSGYCDEKTRTAVGGCKIGQLPTAWNRSYSLCTDTWELSDGTAINADSYIYSNITCYAKYS